MKTRKKILFGFGLLSVGLFAIAAGMGYLDVDVLDTLKAIVFGDGGTIYAFAATAVVAGKAVDTTEVKSQSPDLDMDAVSKKITQMKPAATPLDTILREVGTAEAIKSFVTQWYAVDTRGVTDTVAVDMAVPAPIVNLEVSTVNIWNRDDTILVQGVVGGDGEDLILYVAGIDVVNNQLQVQAINPVGTDVPVISATTPLTRLGNAKNEKDAQTDPYAVLPTKSENYCQIHMAQVEESVYQRIHQKEVDWNFTDYKAQSIYDMRRGMEFTSLFGKKALLVDAIEQDEKYFSNGITRYITKGLNYGTGGADRTIDNATFIDWTRDIFTGNSGSDTRILFGGSDFMTYLSKVDTVTKQVEAKQVEIVHGIKFQKIETTFGVLLIKHHNLFNDVGWGEKGLVLDINNIEKHVFKPMSATNLDLKTPGLKNVDAVKIDECFCTVTRYPDTHAIISPLP